MEVVVDGDGGCNRRGVEFPPPLPGAFVEAVYSTIVVID
jgi:hypothetical protein